MANITMNDDPIALLHMHFTSDPIAVGDVTMSIADVIDTLRLSAENFENIEIVVSEVINNIAEHAYQGRADGRIEMAVARNQDNVFFHFIDTGVPMPDGSLPLGEAQVVDCEPENIPEGGFGWFLIRTLCHNLTYRRMRNENHLTFQIQCNPSA